MTLLLLLLLFLSNIVIHSVFHALISVIYIAKLELTDNINFFLQDMIPIITANAPAGTSTHTVVHFMQEYVSGIQFIII